MELRHVVRCVYREAGTGFADNKQLEEGDKQRREDDSSALSTLPDTSKMKELVHRSVLRMFCLSYTPSAFTNCVDLKQMIIQFRGNI